MTADDFRAMALAFPDAHEAPHFERTSFRIGKKIFATLAMDGLTGMVRVAPLDRLEALIAAFPAAFFSFGGWTTKFCSLGVTLAAVEPDMLRALMAESYAHAAPKAKRARGQAS